MASCNPPIWRLAYPDFNPKFPQQLRNLDLIAARPRTPPFCSQWWGISRHPQWHRLLSVRIWRRRRSTPQATLRRAQDKKPVLPVRNLSAKLSEMLRSARGCSRYWRDHDVWLQGSELFLTDAADGKQVYDAAEAPALFPHFDDSLRRDWPHAGKLLKLFHVRRVQINRLRGGLFLSQHSYSEKKQHTQDRADNATQFPFRRHARHPQRRGTG